MYCGTGSFLTPVDLPGVFTGDKASIALADVDGDDYVDIIVGTSGIENYLLINNGAGSFPTFTTLPGGNKFTRQIATGDVNGDDKVDIIIGNNNGDANQVLINDGTGSFLDNDIVILPGGLYTFSIATADINGDDKMDIIVGNPNAPSQLLIGNNDGTFTESYLPGANYFVRSIFVADVNDDGKMDIIIGNGSGGATSNQLLINDGPNGVTGLQDFSESILIGGNLWTESIFVAAITSAGAPPTVSNLDTNV